MILLRNLSAALLFLFCTAFTPPHHGWANYDQTKTIDYTGTVTASVYENPHSAIKINQDKKIWTVILAPVSRMQARGVKADMIKKGSSVRVVGYPHKTIKDEMRAERIFVDGAKYELR
ncbi:hypothetical protein DLD77_10465 [Chitinophaga alhagiae]|uniref:DUF5666 domain-containing protein n=1 Tax=Chitinophaga alhagiae TaxID=2203219 RepID=A0ABM6WDR0_9BACT|nr:DUF6152 family protein [Chitinophaga alhagiae]AWO02088.1 hypothetical protein DLD77_10465 [Chitinophaga alhagiae]